MAKKTAKNYYFNVYNLYTLFVFEKVEKLNIV